MYGGAVPDEPAQTRQRIAENLRDAREHSGLSQAELAEKMRVIGFRVSQQGIAQVESGAQRVPAEELLWLSRILRVSMDALARPRGIAADAWRIIDASREVRDAHGEARAWLGRLRAARSRLDRAMARAAAKGLAGDLADEMTIGRHAAELPPLPGPAEEG